VLSSVEMIRSKSEIEFLK